MCIAGHQRLEGRSRLSANLLAGPIERPLIGIVTRYGEHAGWPANNEQVNHNIDRTQVNESPFSTITGRGGPWKKHYILCRKLGDRDSNPGLLIQSQPSYH